MARFLTKTLETKHGVSANMLVLNGVTFEGYPGDGFTARGNLGLWLSTAAYVSGKALLDNFTFSYHISDLEAKSDAELIVLQKIISSVMITNPETELDEETNILSGNLGAVGFQDATLTEV